MEIQFCFISECRAGRPVAFHTHEALELVYYTAGTGKSTIAKKNYEVKPHVFSITPAGIAHDQKNHTDVTSICIGIKGGELESFTGMWADVGGILQKPLTLLVEELKNRRTGFESICKGILYETEGLIQRQISERNALPQKGALVQKAIEVIQRREGTLTVSEIAQQLYVSKDYLRHLFKEYVGKSPIQYILRARIEKAGGLLAQRELRIGEIAEKCGFENVYYFSRFFHKATGQTPSQFRNAIKGS